MSKKRMLALVLAAVMSLSSATVALADGESTAPGNEPTTSTDETGGKQPGDEGNDSTETGDVPTVLNTAPENEPVVLAEEGTVNSAEDLREALEKGGDIKLGATITVSEKIEINKSITLDLNGYDLEASGVEASGEGTKLIIKDSTAAKLPTVSDDFEVNYSSGTIKVSSRVLAKNGAEIELQNGAVDSSYLGLVAEGDKTGATIVNSKVTVTGGYVIAQEFAVTAQGKGAEIDFVNGVAEARDNAVIAGNGSNGEGNKLGGTTINISGGTLIGHIVTDGYVSCGIYHPQEGTLTITGGTIYSESGCGILMRGGTLDMTGGTVVAEGEESLTGKVGDARVVVPTSGIVFDREANYYDASNTEIEISGDSMVAGSHSAVAVIGAKDQTDDKVTVRGGTFSSDVSSYVPDGISWTQQGDGSFVVGDAKEPSNPGNTGSSGNSDNDNSDYFGNETWDEVKREIAEAEEGDTIKVSATGLPYFPSSVARALKGKDITLEIRKNGITYEVNGLEIGDIDKIWYEFDELETELLTADADSETSSEADTEAKPIPDTGR